jgi:hypothetical protein
MKKTIFLAQLALALVISPAFAGNEKNFTYLALGDSVAFGLNPLLLPPYSTTKPSAFDFHGYPETVAAFEHLLKSKKLMNGSCPGETSGSFLDTSIPDFGCNSPHMVPGEPPLPPFKTTIGLRADYMGSQIMWAESEFDSNKHINLVTLSIGANDILLVLPQLEACGTDPICAGNVLGPVLANYAGYLAEILTRIRAKYQGTLVLVKYYSPSPALDGVAIALNGTMVSVATQLAMIKPNFVPVRFADGFTAFQVASALYGGDACAAGLLIRLPPAPPGFPPNPPCDFHPSSLGSDLLAAAVELALQ